MAICRMVDADINGEPNDGNVTAEKQKCYEYIVPGRSKSDPDRKAYVWATSKKCDDYNEVDDSYCANTMALWFGGVCARTVQVNVNDQSGRRTVIVLTECNRNGKKLYWMADAFQRMLHIEICNSFDVLPLDAIK